MTAPVPSATQTRRARARVRAPELAGAGGWLNTGGRALTLTELRGKIVLLDFWTFCCVNCLHVLDELRPLERQYADVLVIVGVHSPKFPHEADHAALAAAVERYEVAHPILDDPELRTWQQYAVRAWPTLVVVDPEGYVVSVAAGEGHAEAIGRLVDELVAEHEAKGTLRRGDGPYRRPPPAQTALRFPSKVVALPDGRLLVADTGHHSLVELDAGGETVLRRIGSARRGSRDGDQETAEFAEPQGLRRWWVTRSWWPTRPTTCCAACDWAAARCVPLPTCRRRSPTSGW
jgi:thiol-disulfide isomerase/thioredoxin